MIRVLLTVPGDNLPDYVNADIVDGACIQKTHPVEIPAGRVQQGFDFQFLDEGRQRVTNTDCVINLGAGT